MKFDAREQAGVLVTQPNGSQMIVAYENMRRDLPKIVAAKFRKDGSPLAFAQINSFVRAVIKKFDAAQTGETISHSYMGVTLAMPRLELPNRKTSAQRHDEADAIFRVSGKIALELAAVAAGVTPLLAPAYDDFRNWVLDGAPDLGAAAVRIEREPDPKGSDAERQHTVLLEEDAGQLEALIQYYGAYHVRVKIGNAVGLEGPWARRFPIERTNGPLPGIDEPRQGHAQTPCAPDPQL